MNAEYREDDYIDLAEIMNVLLHHSVIIVVVAVISGLIGLVYSAVIATPLYNASAMMIVNSGERYDYVTQDQLKSASSLIDTYAVIIKSDTVMDEVINNLGMEETYKSTVKDVSVSAVNQTQIMKITVTATSPEIALDVCKEITSTCPDVIVNTVKAGSVELVSKANTTYNQVSPNVKRNTLLSIIAGFVIAAGVVILISIMNNKVKGENDLKQMEIPLLGVIPFYELEGK